MISVLFALFLIGSFLNNQVLTELNSCSTLTMASSVRYNLTVTVSIIKRSYSGNLLLSSTGDFIYLFTLSKMGSPVSAIQGKWSLSADENILTLTGNIFYFAHTSKIHPVNLTCTYTCSSNDDAIRSCIATYTFKLFTLETTRQHSFTANLSLPQEPNLTKGLR